MKTILIYLFVPIFLFLSFFIVYTYPAITSFSSHFFADSSDGLQNAWNIWWINKAVTYFHTSIWSTKELHFPFGVCLIGHTLNPFNGLLGILLLKFLTLVETYNTVVIFSFVISGLSMFLFTYQLSKCYIASLVSGFVYTFSNYHFAHTEGHMQLISMEWLPVYILSWYLFVKLKGWLYGLLSTFFLYLILLCDYYYFFYAVISGIILYLWQAKIKKNIFFIFVSISKLHVVIILILFLITIFPIISSLIFTQVSDPLIGGHESNIFSADLLSFFIPGGHSVYNSLTESYWSKIPGNIHENSVYLGWTVILVSIFVWKKRKLIKNKDIELWYFLVLLFFAFSLGPKLQIGGKEISFVVLPYNLLEYLLPILRISGMPIRMSVMIFLYLSLIVGLGMSFMNKKSKYKSIIIIICLGIFIEYFPRNITLTKPNIPKIITTLKSYTSNGYGVVDLYFNPGLSEYFQTIYDKPKAFGYIARTPSSVIFKDMDLSQNLQIGNFNLLCKKYKLMYLIVDKKVKIYNKNAHKIIFPIYTDDSNAILYNICKM